jgi:hypothetical protein
MARSGQRVIDLGDAATQTDIAEALEKVSGAVRIMLEGPLKKRAILVLIKDLCPRQGFSIETIETVLDAAASLDKHFLKPKE